MAVSRWERGASQPSGETYVRLGNLAPSSLCWFFWQRAGLRKSDNRTRAAGGPAVVSRTIKSPRCRWQRRAARGDHQKRPTLSLFPFCQCTLGRPGTTAITPI